MRRLFLAPVVLLAACSGEGAPRTPRDEAALGRALHTVAAQRCTACHASGATAPAELAPLAAPRLEGIGNRRSAAWLAAKLESHHAAGAAEAVDLAEMLRAAWGASPLQACGTDSASIESGARAWRESGCVACHAESGIGGLAAATDRASVLSFITDPSATRPDLGAHRFELEPQQASAIAAFLLRSQRKGPEEAAPSQGIHWECFELRINNPRVPELDGLTPTGSGIAQGFDISHRTRNDHFAMRFRAELTVPVDGEYTFTCGSDDASWLWIDGQQVVENGAIAPYRKRSGTVRLTAGAHALTVVMTEAQGGEELDVWWSGPGFGEDRLDGKRLTARNEALVPPASGPVDEAAAARGREAWSARSCGACHADTPPGVATPPAVRSKPPAPFADLAGGSCPTLEEPLADAAVLTARDAMRDDVTPRTRLAFTMERDGCRSCHVRDGEGGMRAEAAAGLVEVEDVGDEGRLPPSLDQVGHRLRPEWIRRVLGDGLRARHYVKARMPLVPAAAAEEYAQLFRAVDAVPGDDVEPAFGVEAVAAGRTTVGSKGFGCVTCHSFGEFQSTGVKGMDLAIQHERLQPGWFREWLLHPAKHRPGTRMPSFWPQATEAAVAQVDALRSWSSLGAAAPVPVGVKSAGGMKLEPIEKPILHGAFLRGLSARCMAVGSPLRTHHAYDVEHARLAWIWRGSFLDAGGTWEGRAGQLLDPLGSDVVKLAKEAVFRPAGAAADAAPVRVTGWDVDAEGYPTFLLAVGAVTVRDAIQPRLDQGGTVLVRRIAAEGGDVELATGAVPGTLETLVDGKPVTSVLVRAGSVVEVVYTW